MTAIPAPVPTVEVLEAPRRFDIAKGSNLLDYHRNGVSGVGFIVALDPARSLTLWMRSMDSDPDGYGVQVDVPLSLIRPPSKDAEVLWNDDRLAIVALADENDGDMVAIWVKDTVADWDGVPVAVFNQKRLLVDSTVLFGRNSWRGDHYYELVEQAVQRRTLCPVCDEPLDDDVVCDEDGSNVRHTRCDIIFRPGERVTRMGSLGIVLARAAEWAWVLWDGDTAPNTYRVAELRSYVPGGPLPETWQVWASNGSFIWRTEAEAVEDAYSQPDLIGILHVMPDGTTEYTDRLHLPVRYPAMRTA